MWNNRSSASRANNRSLIHEQSQIHNNSQLPSLPAKKKLPPSTTGAADQLIKDRINRQHEKVEQQIKKYDEILKKNKNLNLKYQYEQRKKAIIPRPLGGGSTDKHDGSLIMESSTHEDRKDMIKIYGVKLDNNRLQGGHGRREYGNHDNSVIREERRDKLPSLRPAVSIPKGLQPRGVAHRGV